MSTTILQDFFGTAELNHRGRGVCVGATNGSAAVCLCQRVKLNSFCCSCTKFLLPFNTSHFVFSSRLLIFLEMKKSHLKLSVALPPTLHALVSGEVTDLQSSGLCFAATSTSFSSFLASFHDNPRNKGLKNKEEPSEKERKKKKTQKLHKSPPSECNSTPWSLLGTPLRRHSEQFAEMIYCGDLSASGTK